jgi:genome maintenance exonuclease 1
LLVVGLILATSLFLSPITLGLTINRNTGVGILIGLRIETPMLENHSLDGITEDGFTYFLHENGQKFASVSTILQVVAQYRDLSFSGWKRQRRLNHWKARLGEDVAGQIRREAQIRGTELHQRIANYLRGGKGTAWPQDLLPFGYSIRPTLLRIRPIKDVKFVEGCVFHPSLYYAGKIDAIVQWEGIWSLVEWKTACRPQKREWLRSHMLQSAAYIAAANKTYNLRLRQSLIVVATPGWEAQVFVIEWEELKTYFRQWLNYVKFFWAVKKSINIQTGEPLKLVTAIAPDGSH